MHKKITGVCRRGCGRNQLVNALLAGELPLFLTATPGQLPLQQPDPLLQVREVFITTHSAHKGERLVGKTGVCAGLIDALGDTGPMQQDHVTADLQVVQHSGLVRWR